MSEASFIQKLKQLNEQWAQELTQDGYKRSGGVFELSPEVGKFASDFVNAYANGFSKALNSGTLSEEGVINRGMMYPQECFTLAIANGQRVAMKQRGARKWRRVLGESKNGPCDECVADSQVTHDIDEEFFEFHPSGKCGQQFLHYSMDDKNFMDIPIPFGDNEVIRRRRSQ